MHCALRGLRLTLSCLATAQTARPRGAGAQRRSEAACLRWWRGFAEGTTIGLLS